MEKLKIGIVSFTDPRAVKGIESIDKMNIDCQKRLEQRLVKEGFDVIPAAGTGLVRTRKAALEAASTFLSAGVDALALGCWKWTDPMLAVEVVRRVGRPVCLVGENTLTSTPLGCMSAIGAALWEIGSNSFSLNHHRELSDFGGVARWARGAGALSWLRGKSILLWGGSYCLKMAHLDDDASALKSFLIGDILTEDQYHIIMRAEKILEKSPKRPDKFVDWLRKNGCKIEFDKKMLTPEILRRQSALYLAARDRLAELEGEDIAGVSVKCQPALSEEWGVTGCMLPAFLPFGEDSEGKRQVVATSCEGDIKGLITSLILERITGGIPAGFGDIRNVKVRGRECLVISNCGAASLYYAAVSGDAKKALPRTYIKGQCQGAGGAAVGYGTPAFGEVTIARLIRKSGQYIMQFALGDSLAVTPKFAKDLGWGSMWPVSLFDIGMDIDRFTATVGSNHLSFVPGDRLHELTFFCREAGIEMECLNG